MGLSMESMAIAMPAVDGHPNRVAFRGVLTFVDAVSDRAPAGARGHRVLLTRKAAEEAIPSLLGMGLDYSPRLDCHDTRRKIGVITRAEIVGREIAVSGFLYGRDFPEMVAEIGKAAVRHQPSAIRRGGTRDKWATGDHLGRPRTGQMGDAHADKSVPPHHAKTGRAGDPGVPPHHAKTGRAGDPGDRTAGTGLGMSYEIADAVVEDIQATVWVLNRVTFTGAAVLRRDKAAYRSTWIELG